MKTISKNLRQGDGGLPTTHWSLIVRAGHAGEPGAEQALEALCRAYWYPLYAFIRRQGRPPHEAEDLTQGFFGHLLDKERLGSVRPGEGMRFRSWLLQSFRNYVGGQWRRDQAQRRGGRQAFISIDADQAEQRYDREPVDPANPEKLFERKWVMELLNRVLAGLEKKYANKGKQALFDALAPFIRASDHPASQAEIGVRLGLTPGHVAVEVNRLRHRYEDALRAEIAETVATRDEVDDELRHLLSALSP